jgi:hypothetical protein
VTSRSKSVNDSIQTQRICAGKKCRRQGLHHLSVEHLHKSGWFCDLCKERLLADKLVFDLGDKKGASSL